MDKKLVLLLQKNGNGLHPISRKTISTAVKLGNEGKLFTEGVVFTSSVTEEFKNSLLNCGLKKVTIFLSQSFNAFCPENITKCYCENYDTEVQVLLAPATPELRGTLSMIASRLNTGVTADCTELSFNEKGELMQTRPAFSGNVMATIVTTKRPQMASFRFESKVEEPKDITEIEIKNYEGSVPYKAEIIDEAVEDEKKSSIIIALGGGIKAKEEIESFKALSKEIGAELYSSRTLVDRGYFKKKNQIGLSGQSVSTNLLITFGISGSLQFRAGLQNIGKIISVNLDVNAPIMKIADIPIVGDMNLIVEEMLKAARE